MQTDDGKIVVPVEADISGFSDAMSELQNQTQKFGIAFTSTISSAVRGGKSFEDTLKQLVLRMSSITLSASLKPIETATSNIFQQLTRNLTSALGSSISPTTNPVNVTPFAKGGVVSSPSYFQSGGGLGLMGEAGAEAILPLARGADGNLGVRAGGGGKPVSVVVNISTPDATSFRKSEGRLSALLARSVSRGHRSL